MNDEVWDTVKDIPALKLRGSKPKRSRWFQLHDKSEEMQDCWASIELVLCYIGLHEGWLRELGTVKAGRVSGCIFWKCVDIRR